MSAWISIYVYEMSDTVINGDIQGTVPNSKLAYTLYPLVEYLSSLQQPGTTISLEDIDALVIYKNISVSFAPNRNTPYNLPQIFNWADIDTSYVKSFEVEVVTRLSNC